MSRRRLVGTAAIAGLTLAAAACGGDGRSADAGPRTTSPATASATSPPGSTETPPRAAVPEAYRFSAPALAGGRVDGTDYASTGVALWFWAPW